MTARPRVSPEAEETSLTTSSGRGYVLTLRFTGQQVAGLRGIFSQQCWLNSFDLPLSIVEPFVRDSSIVHGTDLWGRQDRERLKLANFYDMASMSQGVVMASWKEFLSHAPRRLVVLQIENPNSFWCLNFRPLSCLRNRMKMSPPAANCSLARDGIKAVSNSIPYLRGLGFEVVRNVCLTCSTKVQTPRGIVEHIFGDYWPQNVTLLINLWKFSFRLTPDCKQGTCASFTDLSSSIQATTQLNKDAGRYVDLIDSLWANQTRTNASISVMVRLEWFLIRFRRNSLKKIHSCLARVRTLVKEMSDNKSKAVRTILALDVGQFGSGSFQQTSKINHIGHEYLQKLIAEVKTFVWDLYDGKMDFDAWEKTFVTATGGISERTYIANLQSLLVSQADCMVYLGGGHYQELAVQKYKSNHPLQNQCLQRVCES